MNVYKPISLWYDTLQDRKYITTQGIKKNIPIPPISLRYRIQGNALSRDFLDVGKRNFEEIKIGLERIGYDLNSFENILDFGCGCGRTAIWFHINEINKNAFNFYGTDIEIDAIKWCCENLGSGNFNVNKELPPVEYQDNFFDLIYAISVFTHMREDHQFLWLEELKRILKPNGILIISLHGQRLSKDLTHNETVQLQKTGYSTKVISNHKDWAYLASYHTKEYVLNKFGQYFKVLDYTERSVNNLQDMVVLQKMA